MSDDFVLLFNKGTQSTHISREQALHELLNEAHAIDVVISTGDDVAAYLRSKGAIASTFGDNDIFILPEFAQNVRVLREEMIHIYQNRLGMVNSMSVVDLEIQARELLVLGRHVWGITNPEVHEIIREIRKLRETGVY